MNAPRKLALVMSAITACFACCAAACPPRTDGAPPAPAVEDASTADLVAPSVVEVQACAHLTALGCPQQSSCARGMQAAVADHAISPDAVACLVTAQSLDAAKACAATGQITCSGKVNP